MLKAQKKWPFQKIVRCNIGNPAALGQTPPEFAREVLSLVVNQNLLNSIENDDNLKYLFASEIIERARYYSNGMTGGIGAYTDSKGLRIVRDEIVQFIQNRDGYPSDPESIFLTDGASGAAKLIIQLIMRGPGDALLAPAPSYPLYSALAALSNGTIASYYLDEAKQWDAPVKEIERAYNDAIANGQTPRALVVINPGNPTGASLSRSALEDIVRFCQRNHVVLLADEVYQENVYTGAPPFISFKQIVRDLRADDVTLASFHSISKGFTGECGLRGGYMELANLDPEAMTQLLKLASLTLCANVIGQLAVGLMVHPPASNQIAAKYTKDRDEKLASLERRALKIAKALDALPGISCDKAQGAMYLFPNIDIPPLAVAAARKRNLQPDAFYALNLLEATGLVVVPGSGFGQLNGTWHFRTTFLPPEDDIDVVISTIGDFHHAFLTRYAESTHTHEL
mmetsp:Transcript_8480/g.10762  ORF Transcript_8480/g.10762 Transcript_8480/m.10762 type:complete len:455 (-) Transcript_8480:257-1621(-)